LPTLALVTTEEIAVNAAGNRQGAGVDQQIKPEISYDGFANVDMRVGRVIDVQPFPRSRNPSYKVEIDFGVLGRRWSSAQITHYKKDDLIGRLVVAVVNLTPRNIAGFKSYVLILGVRDGEGRVILLAPRSDVEPGEAVF
jgi:tRNA-binding protein